MKEFCSTTIKELKSWFEQQGEAGFRATQAINWIYKSGVANFSEMRNVSSALRQKIADNYFYPVLDLSKTESSKSGETTKFLWRLRNGYFVESVVICSGKRRTVCVSSQVGCPGKCAFCASGKLGFVRNLTTAEIVEQVIHIKRFLQEKGEVVSHVVFMGMGEPLENQDAVFAAISFLIDPNMLKISQRRISLSTVGVTPGIENLAKKGFKINLVLSLHATNQQLRQKIVPYAKKYPLEKLLLAVDDYFLETKRDITYEYTLIAGLNDQPEHARELASLLSRRQCAVNIIPYNPIKNVDFKRPSTDTIKRFCDILTYKKIINTCRYTKGDDIAAACGQLAAQWTENK